MEFKDYYEILGVDPDADQKTLKSAYRKLARKYHPDVSAETDAEERFKELSEAYEVLKDDEKRAQYDTLRQHGGARGFEPPPGYESGAAGGDYQGGFSEFFEEIFGQAAHGSGQGFSRQHFSQRGDDIELSLALFLEDVYRGETRTISYQVPVFDQRGHLSREQKTLKVKIPAGTTDGERIRLKGQGAPGMGDAPAGDLFLHIAIADHPLYVVDGVDLSITVPVSPWEAAIGCKLQVPTLDGRINLSVPANSQNGKRFRVQARGLGKSESRGDLYVVLRISMPETSSEEETELWQKLAAESKFDPRENWE